MPFKSEKQRRYLWVHEPELAERWSHKYGSKPQPDDANHRAAKTVAAKRLRHKKRKKG